MTPSPPPPGPLSRAVASPGPWRPSTPAPSRWISDFGGREEKTLHTELSRCSVPLTTLVFATSYYISYNGDVPDWLVFGLFTLVATPLLLEGANGFLGERSDQDAVLLPFMDSVTH